MAEQRILRTTEAARYIGLSVSTVEKMRLDGTGPVFIRLGERAVGYDVAELDAWLEEKGARGHVSREGPAGQ